MNIFRRFNEVGVTVVVASHDVHLHRALRRCGASMLDDGRVSEAATRLRPRRAAVDPGGLIRMKQWLERHLQTLVGSLGRLWQHPFATLLTILVIGIALALPACLHVLVQNVRSGDRRLEQRARHLRVLEAVGDRSTRRSSAAERIRQRRDVDEVTIITADEALEEFRARSGFGAALDALKDNPLPHALVVRPDAEFRERRADRRRCTAELRSSAGGRHRAARHRMGQPLQRDPRRGAPRCVLLAAALLRARRPGDRRQHDPARHREPPRRDRGHQAGRRQRRLRAPAVSLQRRLVRAGRRRSSPG